MLVPTSVIVATAKVLTDDERVKETSIDIGLDARAATPAAEHRKPRLLVLVVGETARAKNWGLSGYARQTTPELAAMNDVINFSDVTSCGTATEVSVPCMFSPYGRRHYDEDAIRAHKGLLHVLDHAGLSVLWRDNQSGCKGVCTDLPTDRLTYATDRRWCGDSRCFDDILLEGLDQRIDAAKGDMVVVLHQLGNHGPSYFERYTEAYRRFNPTCDTAELGNCPVEAVVNTYDNALLYTDHILADTIRLPAAAHRPGYGHALPLRPRRVARRVRPLPARHALQDRAERADPRADGHVVLRRYGQGPWPRHALHGRGCRDETDQPGCPVLDRARL